MFVPKLEAEGINVSRIHPLREALFLVGGVIGGAMVLFVVFAVGVEFTAPLIPPGIEHAVFGGVGDLVSAGSHDSDRRLEMRARADTVLEELLNHWPEAPYPIQLRIQDSPLVNAFALPGGTILVTSALMDEVEDEDELAFVLAHELGHFAHRDHLRGLGRGVGLGLISIVLGSSGVGAPALNLVDHADQAAARLFDRRDESAADAFALELLIAARGDGNGAAAFLKRLDEHAAVPDGWLGYMSTHPSSDDRITALERLQTSSR